MTAEQHLRNIVGHYTSDLMVKLSIALSDLDDANERLKALESNRQGQPAPVNGKAIKRA